LQIVFWICSFGQATDQTETLFVTPFGVEQGLRQSMVTRVIQDSNGLIWLTTGDGLHCFDGKEFRVFRVPVDAVYSHSDNLMRDMIEGNPGILTTSSSSSLLQFNTSTGTFSIVFRKNGSHPVLLDQMIDHRPVAWIHGIGPQLVGTDSLLPLKLIFEKNNELPAGFLPKHAVIDKSGKFLISGDDGILVLDTDNRMNESTIPARWIPVSGCQAIARDRTGRVFILACGKIYQYSDRRVQQVFFDTRITSQMSLFIDSKDNFWLTSTENGRQYKLSNGIMTELRICFREGKYIDSISPGIKSVFEDDHFNLWFGTDNNGVLFYSPGKVEFQRKDIGFTRCITWFNHEIWAGTYNDGLWRLSPDLKKATRIHSDRRPEGKALGCHTPGS
jgi:ligand-binding sensor domain-containing protein